MERFQLADWHRLSRNVFTVLALFCLADITHSWRPYALKLYSPGYMSSRPDIIDCNTTIDQNSEVNFYVNIKRDQANAFVHLTYLFADRDGNYTLAITNKTINMCAFLANRKIDFALRIVFAVGERFGQLPTRCPIKKKLYYVKNMKISAENFPPAMPETKGILMFTWMGKVNGAFKTYFATNFSFALENVYKPTEGRK